MLERIHKRYFAREFNYLKFLSKTNPLSINTGECYDLRKK